MVLSLLDISSNMFLTNLCPSLSKPSSLLMSNCPELFAEAPALIGIKLLMIDSNWPLGEKIYMPIAMNMNANKS